MGSVGSRAKSLVPAGAIGSLGAKLGSGVQGLQQSGSGAGILPEAEIVSVAEVTRESGEDAGAEQAEAAAAESGRRSEVESQQPSVVENKA